MAGEGVDAAEVGDVSALDLGPLHLSVEGAAGGGAGAAGRDEAVAEESGLEIDFAELTEELQLFQEDEMVKQALQRGVDLRRYGQQIDSDLRMVESESVQDYVEQSDRVLQLHQEMQECDTILARMQEMLLGFQADLGGISEEIRHLQDESISMNVKLKNRREVEDKLRGFLSNVVLPPDLTDVVCEGEVNDAYLEYIILLNSRMAFLARTRPSADGTSLGVPPVDTAAARAVLADLERLKTRAVGKIRDYFNQHINALKKPKTNVHVLRENYLAKYRQLYKFLADIAPEVAEELRAQYISIMSRTLHNLFRAYHAQLARLDAPVATKSDVIAVEEIAVRGMLGHAGTGTGNGGGQQNQQRQEHRHHSGGAGGGGGGSGGHATANDSAGTAGVGADGAAPVAAAGRGAGADMGAAGPDDPTAGPMPTTATAAAAAAAATGADAGAPGMHLTAQRRGVEPFCLGDRDRILDEIDSAPILVHVAQAEGKKYPYECIVRSVVKHLSDSATSEFLFLLDFFKTRVSDTFNDIFARTLNLCLENMENHLISCADAVGILLMIKITHAQRLVMERRRIPVLDGFFDRLTMMLWPRFKHVLEAHRKSIQSVHVRRMPAAQLSVTHMVTVRYAELVSSLLSLHGGVESLGVGGGGEEMLLHDIANMRADMVDLLRRLGSQLGGTKEQAVFTINNLDHILSVLRYRHVMGEEVSHLEELVSLQRELFVEQELAEHFSNLIRFVQETEAKLSALESGGGGAEESKARSGGNATELADLIRLEADTVQRLHLEFSSSWRNGIEVMYHDTTGYFSDRKTGTDILKQVLTQLLLYYTRFQDIVKRCWRRPLPFVRDLVSTNTILAEIRSMGV